MFEKIKQLLDWVYRKNCYICRKVVNDGSICQECFEKIEINEELTPRILNGVKAYAASFYTGNLRKLIRGLKYHNQREMAVEIAQITFCYWKSLDISSTEFEIVPVPLYFKREKKRRYNHMALVAKEFSKLTGYEVNEQIVTRIKETKPQYKLTKQERRENLRNAFKINKTYYNNKPLLLIDDICTTGTTIEELINSFKKENINNLCVIVCSVPVSEAVYQN